MALRILQQLMSSADARLQKYCQNIRADLQTRRVGEMGNSPSRSYSAFSEEQEQSSLEHDGAVNAVISRCPQGGAFRKNQEVTLFIDASGIRIVPQSSVQFQAISFFHIKKWSLHPKGCVTLELIDGPSYSFRVPVAAEVFNALTAKTSQIFAEIRHRELSQRAPTSSPLTACQLEAACSPRCDAMLHFDRTNSLTSPVATRRAALSMSPAPETDDCPLSPAQRIKRDRRSKPFLDLRRAALSMSPLPVESPPESPVLRKEIVSHMRTLNSSLAVVHRRKLDMMAAHQEHLHACPAEAPLKDTPDILDAGEGPSMTKYNPHFSLMTEVMVPQDEKETLDHLDQQASQIDNKIDHYMSKLKRVAKEQQNPLCRFVPM